MARAVHQRYFVAALVGSPHKLEEVTLDCLARCYLRSDAGLVAGATPHLWSPESLFPGVREWPREVAELGDAGWSTTTLEEELASRGHGPAAVRSYLDCWQAAVAGERQRLALEQ